VGERPGVTAKDPIETEQFDSSNLVDGLYDIGEEELYISFEREAGTNSVYVYQDVPESEWEGLTSASSHGSYHYDNIRLDYSYEELTDFHEPLADA
jgi:hypothetical protein